MALKAKKPESKEKRLKLFLYGSAGVGKTTAAIQFPNAYIIDTEKGTDFYSGMINKAGSVVFQTVNSDEIIEELKQLLTTKHDYRTLIIDPITQVYNSIQEKWTRIFEAQARENGKNADTQDFGMRFWGKVKSEFKMIQRLILKLDMNVIITAHQKDVYGQGMTKIGVSFDSMKGEDYLYDLIMRVEKRGKDRYAVVEKERSEPGMQKFPADFIWSYENFCKFYGKEILEKESAPVEMASQDQVKELNRLLGIVKIDEETITKWLEKADCSEFSEMTSETIQKCVDFLKKKISNGTEKAA